MYYEDCMPQIIEQARNRIKESGNARAMMSTYSYLRDFCTVRMNLGRGTGATAFIKNNMKRQDLAFFHSQNQLQRFRRLSGFPLIQLIYFQERTDRFRPYRIPDISDITFYIDEFTLYWSSHLMDLLYSQIAIKLGLRQSPIPLLVLLG